MLMEFVRRPLPDTLRSHAINLLGTTPESPAKNTLLTDIVRNNQENADARRSALTALSMSRSAAMLPSVPFLIRVARNHPKMPVRKVAIQVLGQTGDQRLTFFSELLSKD